MCRCAASTLPGSPSNVECNRRYHDDFDALATDGVGHFSMMEKPGEFNARLADVIASL
jgi:sigma-B regulation protein RsbQ